LDVLGGDGGGGGGDDELLSVGYRPGNSSQSFLEPEFISEKFLRIYVIFDIDKILFLNGRIVFRYIDP
jgi:hypothetical protein